MASSTAPLNTVQQAEQDVLNGIFDFRVIAKIEGPHDITYIAVFPMMVLRQRMPFPYGGRYTKFGRFLVNGLECMRSVNVFATSPYTLNIHLTNGRRHDDSVLSVSQVSGLHSDVCVTIQNAILSNHRPLQRLVNWLRKL